MFVESAVLHLTGGSVNENSAKTDAGGIYFRKNTHGTIDQTVFRRNISQRQGGGIYLLENLDPFKQFRFSKLAFNGNEAVSGGGMYLTSTSPVLEDITFSGNTTKYEGAGLTVANGTYPNLSNCTFEKNKASSGAGMFSANGASATLNNVSFFENESVGYSGAPTGYGGAIYCGGTGNFNALTIKGNNATHGGGAYLAGAVNITNALITGNYATGKGGGAYIDNTAPVLTNTTFASNNALLGGGGIYADRSGNSKIRNSLIYGNSSGLDFVNGLPKLSYSFVEGRTDATNGNIPGSTDPQFEAPHPYADAPFTIGNYFLKATSQVIDKGDNSVFQAGAVPDLSLIATDLLGNTRFYNSTADIGAYEYQPNVVIPVTLILFEALIDGDNVEVSWKTMDAFNVSHFEIERSEDGVSFEKVGSQEANENGIYNFTDADVPQGTIYYRLKIIEMNEIIEYSSIKTVNIPITNVREITNEGEVTIYPIPSTSLIHIADKTRTLITGTFRVYTATGKIAVQTDSNPVNIQSLPPGLYFIHITDTTKNLSYTQKIIKY